MSSASPSASLRALLAIVHVGGPVDLLLGNSRQVDPDGEHVHIGGHAGGAHCFGAFQVGFGRAHGLFGGLQVFRGQHGSVVGAGGSGDDIHLHQPLFFAGHFPGEFGGRNRVPGLPGIIYRLIYRHLRLEVVEEVRTVQRADGEVLHTELVLSEQRAEDKHRIVTAGEGFGVVDLGESSAAGLGDTSVGGPGSGSGAGDRPVLSYGDANGVAERQ